MRKWKVNKTLLIVGEGFHDVAFLNHVKQFPGVCGNNMRISIKSANGKGALGVINHTIRLIANAEYDRVVALFDTDTDWTEKTAKLAKKYDIQVLLAVPCFEAMLLRVLREMPGNPRQLKSQFAPFVNNKPSDSESYATNFRMEVLIAARNDEPTIDALLTILGI